MLRKSKNVGLILVILVFSVISSHNRLKAEINTGEEQIALPNAITSSFEWNFTLTDFVGNTPVIVDLDLDGTPEILVG